MASGSSQLLVRLRPKRIFLFLAVLYLLAAGAAAPRFTERQLEALRRYVGKTYWVSGEAQGLAFFAAPSPSADSFFPEAKQSFEVAEMVGGAPQGPAYYYRVTFGSGKEGYINVDSFLEQLNLTVLTVDPDQGRKIRSAKEAEEESRREARIRAQPWPEHIKEAVLQRKAVLGMNLKEAREALGKPARVAKIRAANPLMGQQEQWIYEGGPVLTFTNGLLTRVQPAENKEK